MFPFRNTSLFGVAVIITFGFVEAADKPKNELPKSVVEVLKSAKEFELYSLDSETPLVKPKDDFHGWKVLGKTTVKDAKEQENLTKGFIQSVEESKGYAARGFKPRYGIRATVDNKKVDIVISFKYLQSIVYEADEIKGVTIRHTAVGDDVFLAAVKHAGLKVSDVK